MSVKPWMKFTYAPLLSVFAHIYVLIFFACVLWVERFLSVSTSLIVLLVSLWAMCYGVLLCVAPHWLRKRQVNAHSQCLERKVDSTQCRRDAHLLRLALGAMLGFGVVQCISLVVRFHSVEVLPVLDGILRYIWVPLCFLMFMKVRIAPIVVTVSVIVAVLVTSVAVWLNRSESSLVVGGLSHHIFFAHTFAFTGMAAVSLILMWAERMHHQTPLQKPSQKPQHVHYALYFIAMVFLLITMAITMFSGGRTGLLALFGMVVVLLLYYRSRMSLSLALGLLFAFVCACVALCVFSGVVGARYVLIVEDIQRYHQGDVLTSIGQRFEMWKAAWVMFQNHPIFGAGPYSFKAEYAQLVQQGISVELVKPFAHAHNQWLDTLATNGLLGLWVLVALKAVLVKTYWHFLNRTYSIYVRTFAWLGLLLTVAYICTAFTEALFSSRRAAVMLFVFMHTLCLAQIYIRVTRIFNIKSSSLNR